MKAEFNHLNHATWECKYHVVFTPKYRKKLLFGKIKRHLGQVFHDLARAHCRVGCRGDQTDATLNARIRPKRPEGYRCRGACSCRSCEASASPPRPSSTLFFRVVSELDFHYIAVERAFLVVQGRRGRAAVRAVAAAGA
jgi:hypothetical protein